MKLINIYQQIFHEDHIQTKAKVIISGTKQQLEEQGCKYLKKQWVLPAHLMPVMSQFDKIVHEEINLASKSVTVRLPQFMLDYVEVVGKANSNATLSSVIQSLILDQMDREEKVQEALDNAELAKQDAVN
jgi:hypothetical protein